MYVSGGRRQEDWIGYRERKTGGKKKIEMGLCNK